MMRPFTGWHMAAVMVAFFGVVIAVNLVMARFAIGTFGGTVVDNSYVASQQYNRWLAQADAQSKLGWSPKISLDTLRRVSVSAEKQGVPLANLSAEGVAVHPLGHAPAIPLTFAAGPNDMLLALQTLPAGRWRVQLTLRDGADSVKLIYLVQ